MRNEDVFLRVKEQRNILHEIRKRKANWIGHILRRNCLLQRVIERKIKWGRRRRKLLDDLKERRGYSHLKEESLDRTMWRARFGRCFGPIARQTTKWMRYWVSVAHVCNKLCANYLVISDMNNTRHFRLPSSFFSPISTWLLQHHIKCNVYNDLYWELILCPGPIKI